MVFLQSEVASPARVKMHLLYIAKAICTLCIAVQTTAVQTTIAACTQCMQAIAQGMFIATRSSRQSQIHL